MSDFRINFMGKTERLENWIVCENGESGKYTFYNHCFYDLCLNSTRERNYGAERLVEGCVRFDFNSPDGPAFFYSEVFVESKRDVILFLTVNVSTKFWLNENLMAVGEDKLNILCIRLEKGVNRFLLEFERIILGNCFSVRMSDYNYEISDAVHGALHRNLLTIEEIGMYSSKTVRGSLHNLYEFQKNEMAWVIFFPQDWVGKKYASEIEIILISQHYPPRIYKESLCCFFQMDFTKYHSGEELEIHIKYYVNGMGKIQKGDIYISVFEKEKTIQEANNLVGLEGCDIQDRLGIEYYIQNLKSAALKKEEKEIFAQEMLFELSRYVEKYRANTQGEILGCELLLKGSRKKYFISRLDGTVEYYYLTLNTDLSKDRRYPLIVLISTLRYCHMSRQYRNYKGEGVIVADVSQRGITMGSYMGEVAILEAIEDIIKNYPVDTGRIYLSGQSNGAAAVWALATSYPDKFAGIFPVSGRADVEKLINLSNMKVINVSSEYEYLYEPAFLDLHPALCGFRKYTGLLFEKMIHMNELDIVRQKSLFADEMLRAVKIEFPERIQYITHSNRWLDAYWISIHCIECGTRFAKVEACIKGNRITIQLWNGTGVTVRIPPGIDRSHFLIELNGNQSFAFENYQEDEIHIIKNADGFQVKEKLTFQVLSRKGLGVCDIFLDPVRIMVGDMGNPFLYKTAANFASPKTNGFDPNVRIRYPIHGVEEFQNIQKDCSFIIIDKNVENKILYEIKEKTPIRMDRNGFEYQGRYHQCDYCIMQIFESPFQKKKSILYVNANHNEMFSKAVVGRIVILTSYANGLNSIFNNEAIIYKENGFYGIYEWGEDFRLLW